MVRGLVAFTSRKGFTLPSVLIASVILLGLLALALQLSTTSSSALKEQYYYQLAREAAEAGGIRLAECMRKGYFNTSVTVATNTNCLGVTLPGVEDTVMSADGMHTSFSARYVLSGLARTTESVGTISLTRPNGAVHKTYSYTSRQQMSQEMDMSGSRASKRWWFFGDNAVLDFGTSGNTVTASSTVGRPVSHEGITVVAGREGDLKFFSDGLNVWDKNSNLIPIRPGSTNYNPNCDNPAADPFPFGGASQGLCGSVTATQAVASFPINREETRYVVVTNTANANDTRRVGTLYWSLIDFSAANPNGLIIARNLAVAPGGLTRYASEALNARPNAEGNGAIVYTYRQNSPNQLYAFGIWSINNGSNIISGQHPTMSGNTKPIQLASQVFTSGTGQTDYCATYADSRARTGFGSINFSNDYKKMVVLMGDNHSCPQPQRAGTVHVFDISTGDAALAQKNWWKVNHPTENRGQGYSADFSPSGRYVYTSSIYPARIFRYDTSSGNNVAIKDSERFIGKSGCSDYPGPYQLGTECRVSSAALSIGIGGGGGQILRAPDEKMYVADHSTPWLSVIANPEADNAATSAQTAVNVGWSYGRSAGGLKLPGAARSYYGLPQMVSLFSPRFIYY